jgi:inhibitor of KinA sporulation pathway (predicted exonuclease)
LAGKLDQLLVIDVEATCWENGRPPAGQEIEIIEIGVCTLDIASGAPVDRHSILVRPERSEVTHFCTDLTSLTPDEVCGGVTFEHACQILRRRYRSRVRVWASYGDFDRRQFQAQCSQRGIAYPFGPTHINVKNLLAVMHGLRREVGLQRGLELLGLPLDGRHHRGVDDAWNTALLLSRLLLERRAVLT